MTYDVILLACVSDKTMLQRPLGVYNMAHTFRHELGLTTQVIDFTDWFGVEELYETTKQFVGPNTQFIGVSSTFYQTEIPDWDPSDKEKHHWLRTKIGLPPNVTFTISELKKEFPKIDYILGGANSYHHNEYPFFDAVFHSYSEMSIQEYVKNRRRIWNTQAGKKVIEGEQFPVNVENLMHRWEDNDIILPGETLPVEISRGCIFKCKFCNFQLTGKKKMDYIRGADVIADELQRNYDKWGVTNYFFTDDTFNDSTYKLEVLKDSFDKLTFQPQFTTYMRQDLLYAHREQIDLVKELGLRSTFFGIESLRPETAKLVGKGMASDKVKDWLLELRHDLFGDKINFVGSFIIGLPGESIQSVTDTFNWTIENDINSIWAPLFLRPTARYKSDLDARWKEYGYDIQGELGRAVWTNEHTSFGEAATLAQQFYNRAQLTNKLHTWPLFANATLGLWSIDEMQKISIADAAQYKGLALRRIHELMAEYKHRLRNQ